MAGGNPDFGLEPKRRWSRAESDAITTVAGELKGSLATAFEYICGNQSTDTADKKLRPETVKAAAQITDKQLTELRQRVAYHSARNPDCPFVFVVGHGSCKLELIPKGTTQVRLADLAARERIISEGGHLVPSSEIIIYIHQATGLPGPLLEQMLQNMRLGVTYRYFIPVAYSMHVSDIVMELLGDEPDEETLRWLAEGFQVNIVAEPVPVFFSIHNATNEERAIMFVRTPGSSSPKDLLKYGDNRWANQQYQQLMRLWNPAHRTSSCPAIVLPCKDVLVVMDLRRDLTRRLRARNVKDPLIDRIVQVVLGDGAGQAVQANDAVETNRK